MNNIFPAAQGSAFKVPGGFAFASGNILSISAQKPGVNEMMAELYVRRIYHVDYPEVEKTVAMILYLCYKKCQQRLRLTRVIPHYPERARREAAGWVYGQESVEWKGTLAEGDIHFPEWMSFWDGWIISAGLSPDEFTEVRSISTFKRRSAVVINNVFY